MTELKTHIIWIEENIDHDIKLDTDAYYFFKQKFGCNPTKIAINGYFNSYTDFSISIQVNEINIIKKNIYSHLMMMQMGNIAIKDLMTDTYIKFLCLITLVLNSRTSDILTGVELENSYAMVISDMSKILKNPPYVNKIPVKSYIIDHIQDERIRFNSLLNILS